MQYMYLYEYLAIGSFILTVGLFGWVAVNLKKWNKQIGEK